MENNNLMNRNESFADMIKDLENETIPLQEVLSHTSDQIRALESSLHESKTNFVFSQDVCEEDKSLSEGCWSISWEPCSISKKYRLFLTCKDKEFRKPLIECKLEVRLRFFKYIIPFMNSFKEKLKEYRLSLKQQ